VIKRYCQSSSPKRWWSTLRPGLYRGATNTVRNERLLAQTGRQFNVRRELALITLGAISGQQLQLRNGELKAVRLVASKFALITEFLLWTGIAQKLP
jgi:hypothetical protein